MCHPLHSTWVQIQAPGMVELTTTMDSLESHQTQSALSQLQTLERRASSPKTKGRWSANKIKMRSISRNRFGSHHPSSDSWKRRLDHFRPDGTARHISRQSTIDCGSKAEWLFMSFSLCGTTKAQYPFHFKGRDPFSQHQRSHHLFWKLLSFPLLLLKALFF